MLKKFWESFGMSYSDILNLSQEDFDIIKGIIDIEMQFQDRQQKKQQTNAKRNINQYSRRR